MEAKIKTVVAFTVDVTLTENELRALDALASYGDKAFLEVFYKHLGVTYMRPFENDLKTLFSKIKELRGQINDIDVARKKLGLPPANRRY